MGVIERCQGLHMGKKTIYNSRLENVKVDTGAAVKEGKWDQVLDRHPGLRQKDELALWKSNLLQKVQDQRVRLQHFHLSQW